MSMSKSVYVCEWPEQWVVGLWHLIYPRIILLK